MRSSTGSFSRISRRAVCFQPGRRKAPGLFSLEIPARANPTETPRPGVKTIVIAVGVLAARLVSGRGNVDARDAVAVNKIVWLINKGKINK